LTHLFHPMPRLRLPPLIALRNCPPTSVIQPHFPLRSFVVKKSKIGWARDVGFHTDVAPSIPIVVVGVGYAEDVDGL
jgi:hypothetical protein